MHHCETHPVEGPPPRRDSRECRTESPGSRKCSFELSGGLACYRGFPTHQPATVSTKESPDRRQVVPRSLGSTTPLKSTWIATHLPECPENSPGFPTENNGGWADFGREWAESSLFWTHSGYFWTLFCSLLPKPVPAFPQDKRFCGGRPGLLPSRRSSFPKAARFPRQNSGELPIF